MKKAETDYREGGCGLLTMAMRGASCSGDHVMQVNYPLNHEPTETAAVTVQVVL